MLEITKLTDHPERLDRDTLYELRSTLALHPYFQTARLLLLQNLYLLHDPSFDEELQRAAVYVTDRKRIFNIVEAAHYQLSSISNPSVTAAGSTPSGDRTQALIDTFLDSIPRDEEEEQQRQRHRPTPADAAVDYVAYLLENESYNTTEEAPLMKGQSLIDTFLEQEQGRIMLNNMPESPQGDSEDNNEGNDDNTDSNEEEFFTETLARIYIKQGRYQKALDIINRLSSKFPQKNAYFVDQIRFLEKLIINSNKNKK